MTFFCCSHFFFVCTILYSIINAVFFYYYSQPHEMIEQITAFTRQATDIKFKLSQITHLKLDMSSAEAVKRLKGKNLFANGKSKRDRICLILYNFIFFSPSKLLGFMR